MVQVAVLLAAFGSVAQLVTLAVSVGAQVTAAISANLCLTT